MDQGKSINVTKIKIHSFNFNVDVKAYNDVNHRYGYWQGTELVIE